MKRWESAWYRLAGCAVGAWAVSQLPGMASEWLLWRLFFGAAALGTSWSYLHRAMVGAAERRAA